MYPSFEKLAIQQILLHGGEGVGRTDEGLRKTFNIKSKVCLIKKSNGSCESASLYHSDSDEIRPQKEANCLVLDRHKSIICYAFQKIPPYGSKKCEISWSSVTAEQWLDGVLVSLGKHGDCMVLASKDSAMSIYGGKVFHSTAGSTVKALERVRDILTVEDRLEDLMGVFQKEHCFNFVLVGPDFSKVTPWKKDKLFLVSVFDKNFLEESPNTVLHVISRTKNISIVPKQSVALEKDLKNVMIPHLAKGIILKDMFERRAYIPNKTFFLLKKLLEAKHPSLKDLARIVLNKHSTDVRQHFDQFVIVLAMLEDALTSIKRQVKDAYWSYRQCRTLRSLSFFAMQERPLVRKHLFNIWRGNYKDEADFLDNVRPKELINEARRLFGTKFQEAVNTLNESYERNSKGAVNDRQEI